MTPECPGSSHPAFQSVVIRPLLVATTHRLPQRTMESIRPTPGTVSPTDTFRMPSGPCSTAVPPNTFRTVQPAIVSGLVSGVGVSLYPALFSRGNGVGDFNAVGFCATDGPVFAGLTIRRSALGVGSLPALLMSGTVRAGVKI